MTFEAYTRHIDWSLTVGLAFSVVPVLEFVKWLERRGVLGELS